MNVCIWGGFPTEYSFDVHRDQADYWLNIHLVYEWVRWIAGQIFIQCMQGSGGLLTKYSVGVCRDPADYQPHIHLVYAGVRWITDQIFIQCMQGSGGLLTGYSFSVWHRSGRLLTEYSFSVCRGQADCWLNIHSVYAGVRWITDRIFIQRMA